jgi:4'-phosphopantetheinyl transferase
MPLDFINDDGKFAWGIWNITEEEPSLRALLKAEAVPPSITNQKKRLEYLAARALLQAMLHQRGLEYHGLTKDSFGKPFFVSHPLHLSLSHSYPYVAAVIDEGNPVGIDLEQPKKKLLAIASRVLSAAELADAGDDIVKHCIIWCAKESMIKVHGKKDLLFSKNLLIQPFERHRTGDLVGRIVASVEMTVPMHYRVYDNFVLVVTNW